MTRIFISYRRADSITMTGRIYDRLVMAFGVDNIIRDVDDVPAGMDFREFIKDEIDLCDIMLAVVGDKWISIVDEESSQPRLFNTEDYVRIEVAAGLHRTNLAVIPVLVSGARMPTEAELPENIREFAFRNAVQVRDDPDFHRDITRLIDRIGQATGVPVDAQSVEEKPASSSSGNIKEALRGNTLLWAGIAIGVLAAIVVVLLWLLVISDDSSTGDSVSTSIAAGNTLDPVQAQIAASLTSVAQETQIGQDVALGVARTLTSIATQRPDFPQTAVALTEARAIEQTATATVQTATPTLAGSPTATLASTETPQPTVTSQSQTTATVTGLPTQTQTPDITETIMAQASQDSESTEIAALIQETLDAQETLAALSRLTQEPPPTEAVLLGFPGNPVMSNAEWIPTIQEFDGVEMVLVPAGCFMMGSEDGDADERPVHQQCFDRPFWIDRFEVTNEQFDAFDFETQQVSNWPFSERPRERITFVEALGYCRTRMSHLPTEAEWEYAARGPDNLVYPWGDELVLDFVVNSQNTDNQTANVGGDLRADGVSWVGAYDMSGNVWEWTSTIYDNGLFPYPYNTQDGRENDEDQISRRVTRGGGFASQIATTLRATTRDPSEADFRGNDLGFRCAREF